MRNSNLLKKSALALFTTLAVISFENRAVASYNQTLHTDHQVKEFKNLWDTWSNSPTCDNGNALVSFLQDPSVFLHFQDLAAKNPNPLPVDFETSYNSAKDFMGAWVSDGCNPDTTTGPGQFLNYVYGWVHYHQKHLHAARAVALFQDQEVTEFKKLWDTWWNNPTCDNGKIVLDFIKNPAIYNHFKDLAAQRPSELPPLPVDYEVSYSSALDSMDNWIYNLNCPADLAVMPSEFLNDIYQWVNWTVNQ